MKGFYWFEIYSDASNKIKNSITCNKIKNKKISESDAKVTAIISNGPRDRLITDILVFSKELREKTGFYGVIDIIDYFSKFLYSRIIKEKDAFTIVNIVNILDEYISFIGKPNNICIDHGTEFYNLIIKNYCIKNKIKIITGTVGNPYSQVVVEKVYQETERAIKIAITENPNINNIKFNKMLFDQYKILNDRIPGITKFKPNEN